MKYALFKVLKVFLDEPYEDFYLREAARIAKVGPGTAKMQLDWLLKKRFLERKKKGNLYLFKADYKHSVFSRFKTAFNIMGIESSGMIEYMLKECKKKGLNVLSLVLYGSFARGENDSKSDMDILVVSKDGKPAFDTNRLKRYSKAEVNILFYTIDEWRQKAKKDKPFYERIVIEGIPLSGNLPVVE